jgi:hypothetical protein
VRRTLVLCVFLLHAALALCAFLTCAQSGPTDEFKLSELRIGLEESEILGVLGEPLHKEKGSSRLENVTADIFGFFDGAAPDETWIYSDKAAGGKAKYAMHIFFGGKKMEGVLIDFFKTGPTCAALPELTRLISPLGINRVPDKVTRSDATWTQFTWHKSSTVYRFYSTGSSIAIYGPGSALEDIARSDFRRFKVKTLMMRAQTEEERSMGHGDEGEGGISETVTLHGSDGHTTWTYVSSPPSTPSLVEFGSWDEAHSGLMSATGPGSARVRMTIPSCGGCPSIVEIMWVRPEDPNRNVEETRKKMALLVYALAAATKWNPARTGGAPVERAIDVNITVR